MAAISTALEYAAIREAIQLLTTLDSSGSRRDVVSASVGGQSVTYAASSLPDLQRRERELAARITQRNVRKRVYSDFS